MFFLAYAIDRYGARMAARSQLTRIHSVTNLLFFVSFLFYIHSQIQKSKIKNIDENFQVITHKCSSQIRLSRCYRCCSIWPSISNARRPALSYNALHRRHRRHRRLQMQIMIRTIVVIVSSMMTNNDIFLVTISIKKTIVNIKTCSIQYQLPQDQRKKCNHY